MSTLCVEAVILELGLGPSPWQRAYRPFGSAKHATKKSFYF